MFNGKKFTYREFLRKYYLNESNVNIGVNPKVNVQGYSQGAGAIASVSAMIQLLESTMGQGKNFTYQYAGIGKSGKTNEDLRVYSGSNEILVIELKYSRDNTSASAGSIKIPAGSTSATPTNLKTKLSGVDIIVVVIGEKGANYSFAYLPLTTRGSLNCQSIFNDSGKILTNYSDLLKSGVSKLSVKIWPDKLVNEAGGRIFTPGAGNKTPPVNEGTSHMLAYTDYVINDNHNNVMLQKMVLLPGISLTVDDIKKIQCKFDSDYNSCFAVIKRSRDDRWLPIIPDWTKTKGGKQKYGDYENFFKKNISIFVNNASDKNIVKYDYSAYVSGTTPGYVILSGVNPTNASNRINQPNQSFNAVISAQIATSFGLSKTAITSYIDSIINNSGSPAAIIAAFNAFFADLTPTNKIGAAAVKSFVAAGVDIDILIGLIQEGIKQSALTSAAAKAILKEDGRKPGKGLKALYNQINNIKLKPNKSTKISKPKTPALHAMRDNPSQGPGAVLNAINKYRSSKGWATISDINKLMGLAKPPNKLDGNDYRRALENEVLAESKGSLPTLFEFTFTNDAGISDIDNIVNNIFKSESNDIFELPDDFLEKTGLEVSVMYDENALETVSEILQEANIGIVDFMSSLTEVINQLGAEAFADEESYIIEIPSDIKNMTIKITDFKSKYRFPSVENMPDNLNKIDYEDVISDTEWSEITPAQSQQQAELMPESKIRNLIRLAVLKELRKRGKR